MKDSFQKILVIGAGPVVIGQSSELDYAGTQICRTLKEAGKTVVVVNPNPATVMTDKHFADAVYLEPLGAEILKKIIETEKPEAILAAAAGKKGIELCLEMYQNGDFKDLGVELLDVQPDVYKTLDSRRALNTILQQENLPFLQEEVVNSEDDALAFAQSVGFPVSVRAAFSADAGSFIPCTCAQDLMETFKLACEKSMLGQVAVQKCITGYKEINVQCVRDASGHCEVLCTTEYMDVIGIHSGDSIAVIPAKTLPKQLLDTLCEAAKAIANRVNLNGTCLVRFAVSRDNKEYVVFGADSAFSRATALCEKASGFPLSAVCTKFALGETLEDIAEKNFVLPTASYYENHVCVRIPKWSFEKFGADAFRKLGDTMKSTGEVFACGETFASAFYKALLSLQPVKGMKDQIAQMSDADLLEQLSVADDRRVFMLYEALGRNIDLEKLERLTNVDKIFLSEIQSLTKLAADNNFITDRITAIKSSEAGKQKKVLVIGAGSTSIGLGTDRDFAVTLASKALSDFGKQTVVLNDNPAANSTSLFAADSVYVAPIDDESVAEIAKAEQVDGALLAFGGGNAVRKSELLKEMGVEIYGPDAEMHRILKNKLAFTDLLDEQKIRHIDNRRVLVGKGAHVDVLSDGENILIPGICEHVEKAKVHSGDSLAVYPSLSFNANVKEEIVSFAERLCRALKLKGILNMQFVVYDNEVYVISASVVATRNIPFMTKATGLPIVELATRLMLGETLSDLGLGTGLYKEPQKVYVRVPVFSFEHLEKIDVRLGDEMRSTGEVIGVGDTYDEAVYKGFLASGMRLKRTGGVMISVADSDKPASVALGEAFLKQGFKIYATANTAKLLNANHVAANAVRKIHEGEPNTLHLILQNKISYLVSTAQEASHPNDDDVKIRRTALLRRIPVLPSVEMALALTECLEKNDGLEEIKVNKL